MKKKLYLCGVDFQHELGEAMGGTDLYLSIEDLKENRKCWKSCGIVEIEVDTSKYTWVEQQDLWNPEGSVTSTEMQSKEYKTKQIEHWKQRIEKQKQKVKGMKNYLTKLEKELDNE